MKIDLHNHTTFSSDGRESVFDMVKKAEGIPLTYYGVSDHFDYDYKVFKILVRGKEVEYIDEEAYFSTLKALQKEREREDFHLLVGAEFGFGDHPDCFSFYQQIVEKYDPDYVINSVHQVDGEDCYFPEYFVGKTKEEAYGKYLKAVSKSLDAPYRYDIVAHVGYVSRYSPFEEKQIDYPEFSHLYDEILRKIIEKGKILEINTSKKVGNNEFLPDVSVLKRYFQLGGRLISFGSDAHVSKRIGEKWDMVTSLLKEIGFTHFTVPTKEKYIKIEF